MNVERIIYSIVLELLAAEDILLNFSLAAKLFQSKDVKARVSKSQIKS